LILFILVHLASEYEDNSISHLQIMPMLSACPLHVGGPWLIASPSVWWKIALPPSSGSKCNLNKQAVSLLLAWLVLWPWGWRQYVPPNLWQTSARLDGVTSYKILFIVTVMTTINLTMKVLFSQQSAVLQTYSIYSYTHWLY
jgi:hypothetical protein